MRRSNEPAPTPRLRGRPTWTFETMLPVGNSSSNESTMSFLPPLDASRRLSCATYCFVERALVPTAASLSTYGSGTEPEPPSSNSRPYEIAEGNSPSL